jgi:hypothetical protein
METRIKNHGVHNDLTIVASTLVLPPPSYLWLCFMFLQALDIMEALTIVFSSVQYFMSHSHWGGSIPIRQVHCPLWVNICLNQNLSPFKNLQTKSSKPFWHNGLSIYSKNTSIQECNVNLSMWSWSLTCTTKRSKNNKIFLEWYQ